MIDFKHTSTGDIDLIGDDISYTISDGRHKRDILLSKPGDIIEAPLLGVGIFDYLNNENPETMLRSIRQNFVRDGMRVSSLSYVNGAIKEDASYD